MSATRALLPLPYPLLPLTYSHFNRPSVAGAVGWPMSFGVIILLFNRPSVAGAVLQTALSIINSFI